MTTPAETSSVVVSSHLLIQIVYFHQSNADNDVHATHNRGVVARREGCYDRRLACLGRGMAPVLNVLDLVLGDDATDDRSLPVIGIWE